MSSISPITLGADLAALGRGVDPVYRPARGQSEPVVQPAAVILPRTAAWLNLSVAADLTTPDVDGVGQASAGPSGSGSGFEQQGGQAASDSAAQPSLVASLNAQSVAATAASAAASSQSASQDGQAAGFGSVVQLV